MNKENKEIGKFDFVIKLGQTERNALKLLCAKYDMNYSQVITMAIDNFYRCKLNEKERGSLIDDSYCNCIIGETINANRGVGGYDPEVNDIPENKKHLLIE